MGIIAFLRERRRRKTVQRHPVPLDEWEAALADLPILKTLDDSERTRLRELSAVFLAEKDFHPVQGAEIDYPAALRIAALACLPILEIGIDWYADWKTVIVVPEAYGITRSEIDEAGVVHEYGDELGGEVMHLGPVVLSLRDVADAGWGDGYNVVVHEAAHKIDGRDGAFDGCPPLPKDIAADDWRTAFTTAYERVRAPRPRKGRRGPRIDDYAAFSPDEFFAVSVESFFETPVALKRDFPAIYALLARFFRQDPYERLSR